MSNYELRITNCEFPTTKVFCIVFCFLFFSACSIFKKAQTKSPDDLIIADISSPDSIAKVLHKVIEHYPQFEWFSAKANVSFSTEDQDLSFNAFIRMRKDSAIWISASMGIEGARMLFTKDSVKFMNRLKSEYYVGAYSYFDTILNAKLNYDMLQALLTSNLSGILPDLSENYSLHTNDSSYYLKFSTLLNLDNVLQSNVQISKTAFFVKSFLVNELAQKRSLCAIYSEHQLVSDQTFPFQIFMDIQADKKASLSLHYDKIEFDKALEFPFKIPDSYTFIVTKKDK